MVLKHLFLLTLGPLSLTLIYTTFTLYVCVVVKFNNVLIVMTRMGMEPKIKRHQGLDVNV